MAYRRLGQPEVLRERAAGTAEFVYPTVPAGQTARQAALDYWRRVLEPLRPPAPRPLPTAPVGPAPAAGINWWLVGGLGGGAVVLGLLWALTAPPART